MANQKRTFKFYRKNEAEIMIALGMQPTLNSGSGWVEKEDGQSEHLICQLKSTDAQSITLKLFDMHRLQYNAEVSNKIPVFALQFLGTDETFLLMKPEQLLEVAEYISVGKRETVSEFMGVDLSNHEEVNVKINKVVKSSLSAREEFNKENEKKFNKGKRSAR